MHITKNKYNEKKYLSCSVLISWGCLTSSTFFSFFAMSQFDWPITTKKNQKKKKKVETMEAYQNRRFYGKMKCLPLWPTYIGEKGRTLGKTYWIKAWCYWEHIGNLMGTHSEFERNKGKMKKSPPPQPPQPPKTLFF
jgi:hypothetical protein